MLDVLWGWDDLCADGLVDFLGRHTDPHVMAITCHGEPITHPAASASLLFVILKLIRVFET